MSQAGAVMFLRTAEKTRLTRSLSDGRSRWHHPPHHIYAHAEDLRRAVAQLRTWDREGPLPPATGHGPRRICVAAVAPPGCHRDRGPRRWSHEFIHQK